ncbi:MAG: hypothetical protein M5U34_28095 [Chloroflexi bacterium]|nr:hypothetical protein [Chloroflexota bacterium]
MGRDLTGIGQAQGYHGRGLYPANLWSPNQIIADRFALRLADEIEAPVWAEAYWDWWVKRAAPWPAALKWSQKAGPPIPPPLWQIWAMA